MRSNYREEAYKPQEIRHLATLDHRAVTLNELSEVINHDFRAMSGDEYKAWVKEWKFTYETVSAMIRANKKNEEVVWYYNDINFNVLPISDVSGERASYVMGAKKIANTLLNTREFAKNIRNIDR
jgi:hypothetical protein